MTLKLNGSTSGSVSIDAPANGPDVLLELPTDSIKPGMVLVANQSFSAASSVSVNNCFTSTYENYRVMLTLTACSAADVNIGARMRASGVDASGGTDYVTQSFIASGGATIVQSDTTSQWLYFAQGNSSNPSRTVTIADFIRPAVAINTSVLASKQFHYSASFYVGHIGMLHNVAAAYDGFSIIPATGTITGSVRVFAYRNNL